MITNYKMRKIYMNISKEHLLSTDSLLLKFEQNAFNELNNQVLINNWQLKL